MNIELKYIPSETQARAHKSSATYILFGGAMGGGKSVCMVNDLLQNALEWEGNRVGIFRWENSTFSKTTYKTMAQWVLSVPGLVLSHNKSERIIKLINGSEIVYGGIKPSASVGGDDPLAVLKSLEIGACGIDEVTDVPKRFYDILCGRVGRLERKVRNTRTGVIEFPTPRVFCTANPEPGWAKYEWVDRKLPGREFFPSKLSDNPYAPEGYEARLLALYPKDWVAKYISGDWSAATTYGGLYPYDWCLAAAKRIVPSPELSELDESRSIFGVDVSQWGDDKTIIMERRGYKVKMLFEGYHQDTMATVNQVAALADERDPLLIKIDAIGIGAGVFDRLAEMGYPVEAIIGGAKSSDGDRFYNLRAELHWNVRILLERGLLDIPDDGELLTELSSLKYIILNDRRIQIESKETMRKRGLPSPNKSDALMYACDGLVSDYVLGQTF